MPHSLKKLYMVTKLSIWHISSEPALEIPSNTTPELLFLSLEHTLAQIAWVDSGGHENSPKLNTKLS